MINGNKALKRKFTRMLSRLTCEKILKALYFASNSIFSTFFQLVKRETERKILKPFSFQTQIDVLRSYRVDLLKNDRL